MTKRELVDTVVRFVPGLMFLRIKDLYGFRSFSEKKNKHYSFYIGLDDLEIYDFLFVQVCQYSSGSTMIWFNFMKYDDEHDKDVSVKYFTVHMSTSGDILYSTDNKLCVEL